MKVVFQSLLIFSDGDRLRARIKAAAKKESSARLRAIPVSFLGLRLEDEIVHVPTGLHLGLSLCISHACSIVGPRQIIYPTVPWVSIRPHSSAM